jgi:TP901-1 family phage major tail protein
MGGGDGFPSAVAREKLNSNKEKDMAAERGSAFLLKIGSGGATPTYATVAGLKTTQLSINGDPVVITNKGSGGWRELLSGAGVRSVSVAASGIFTGSAAEVQVRGLALSGSLEDYELSFESGERMRGKFLVTRLEYAGDFNGERNYTMALESSGQVASL